MLAEVLSHMLDVYNSCMSYCARGKPRSVWNDVVLSDVQKIKSLIDGTVNTGRLD